MFKFQSKEFRSQTRDYLLDNISKFPSWNSALLAWNDCTQEKLTSTLKAKFKAVLVRGGQDNRYSLANREIIFSKIEHLGSMLEKIGEVFLCNVEMNSAPTYLNMENMVCLNLNITESNLTVKSLQATIFGLLKGEDVSHDLALSSDDDDAPVVPPENFLKCTENTGTESDANPGTESDANSSYFTPNSDDELAKYLESNIILEGNIKKENTDDPDYSPAKIIKKEKKGTNTRKRKRDGRDNKSAHKKRKHTDENTRNMEQCLKIIANLEDLEMKESNMALLAKHLDKHACGRMKTTVELMEENIPKIYDTFKVICKFTISLKKMLNHIPFKIDEKTGEPIILCGGCHLHCVGNWNLPNPTGRPPKESPPPLSK